MINTVMELNSSNAVARPATQELILDIHPLSRSDLICINITKDRCLKDLLTISGENQGKKIEEADLSCGKLHHEKELNKLPHYNYNYKATITRV